MTRVNLEIPSWVQDGLDSGELIRHGGVVYNKHGGTRFHLQDASEPESSEDSERADPGNDDDSGIIRPVLDAVSGIEAVGWGSALAGLSESSAPASAKADAGSGLAVVAGLALVGLAVGAVAAVASASRNSQQSRRELEWRIAEARRDNAQVATTSQRVAAPAGWYDDGSGQLRWWDGQDWTQHYYTASPREGAPAGWYDDGSGQLRWWDGQDWTQHYHTADPRVGAPAGWYDDGSGQLRWWDDQDWTQHYQDSLAGSGRTRARTPALSSASSNDVERDYDFPALSLSRAQWEDQVRVMMQARMISELQWRVLSNARIEDADPELLEWQGRLRTLTAQEFSRSIDSYVASHPEQTLELATAGWYDDGSGRQRWWDGLEWTGYFQTDESRMLPVR